MSEGDYKMTGYQKKEVVEFGIGAVCLTVAICTLIISISGCTVKSSQEQKEQYQAYAEAVANGHSVLPPNYK